MLVRVVDARNLTAPEQRATVVHVGRSWAGWLGHPLANPFRAAGKSKLDRAVCLDEYARWLCLLPDMDGQLAILWDETGRGAKPLACWCGNWKPGDRTFPCHAVLLAQLLNERFAGGEGADLGRADAV